MALIAIWMVARREEGKSQLSRFSDLRLPLISGLCFGVYFILINQSTSHTFLWPMINSHFFGTLPVIVLMLVRRESWQVNRTVWPFIIVNGALDICANLFFILAGQHGRMDVAAVLSSLYPGATVLLAWVILKEHISSLQKLGILTALLAIALLTL